MASPRARGPHEVTLERRALSGEIQSGGAIDNLIDDGLLVTTTARGL